MKSNAIYGVVGVITGYWLVLLPSLLVFAGYADVAAAVWAVAMIAAGIWLSAKGMALLKYAETRSDATLDALETAYRYRNAGIALALTGSGLLVFSWQSFLARFITAVTSAGAPGM